MATVPLSLVVALTVLGSVVIGHVSGIASPIVVDECVDALMFMLLLLLFVGKECCC